MFARPEVTPELNASYNEYEKHALARSIWYQQQGQGYIQEQGNTPQTIGYGLSDSPVALLAWIYEKLHIWSDAYPWEDDEGNMSSQFLL
jgi:LPS sulfotransferase NodH